MMSGIRKLSFIDYRVRDQKKTLENIFERLYSITNDGYPSGLPLLRLKYMIENYEHEIEDEIHAEL